ncbi:MAG: hypothetical protein OXU29_00035 [Gammaproteobacteria bacterium]|nr:hypothetical protein [Gammaproteobacteria bacterium]MDD9871701.1 hypothetical protein [Gammaproteobacteria bacterium]
MRSKIDTATSGKAGKTYQSLLDGLSGYAAPHRFMAEACQAYRRDYSDNPKINGRIFEYLVCEVLAHEGITPFYP